MSESKRLTAALDALRSDDVLTQNEGVAATIQIGATAVPGLLALLTEGGVNRGQVMYALAEIGDARAQEAFLAGVEDDDERARAYAAKGLARIGHPDAIAALLRTLNDAADELHLDRTPSVEALGESGPKTMPLLVDLLMDENEMTRLHSQRALELIVSGRYGFRPGRGFPSSEAAEKMRTQWQNNGDYDYAANAQRRMKAVAKWRRWLADAKEGLK
jgi:HEAT repeat protein